MTCDAAQIHTESVMSREDLEALAVAFGVVSRIFWEEPQNGIVRDLAAARSGFSCEPFASACSLAATEFRQALEAYEANPEGEMGLIRQDRTYLFYEIGYSRTSPYESAYRTPDRTLFGPTTEQVKADFERHGLVCERTGNEPVDHFGLECAYIRQIAQAGAQAGADGDEAAFAGACREIARFLGEHLLVFAPVYLQNFVTRASTAFYRAAGGVAQGILTWAGELSGAQACETLDIADFPLKTRRAGKEY